MVSTDMCVCVCMCLTSRIRPARSVSSWPRCWATVMVRMLCEREDWWFILVSAVVRLFTPALMKRSISSRLVGW
jgi:hypothetical protein